MSDDMERFAEEYPAVYGKLLEINRALAKLQRAVSESHGSNPVSEDFPELPDMLELD